MSRILLASFDRGESPDDPSTSPVSCAESRCFTISSNGVLLRMEARSRSAPSLSPSRSAVNTRLSESRWRSASSSFLSKWIRRRRSLVSSITHSVLNLTQASQGRPLLHCMSQLHPNSNPIRRSERTFDFRPLQARHARDEFLFLGMDDSDSTFLGVCSLLGATAAGREDMGVVMTSAKHGLCHRPGWDEETRLSASPRRDVSWPSG